MTEPTGNELEMQFQAQALGINLSEQPLSATDLRYRFFKGVADGTVSLGGATPQEIQESVDTYLAANPVTPTTDAAQLTGQINPAVLPSDLVVSGEIADVVRAPQIADVVRDADISDVVRNAQISDVVRTADISDVARTTDLEGFVDQSALPGAVEAYLVENPVAPNTDAGALSGTLPEAVLPAVVVKAPALEEVKNNKADKTAHYTVSEQLSQAISRLTNAEIKIQQLQGADPTPDTPENVRPSVSFTASVNNLTVSITISGVDTDGTIPKYTVNWGDGTIQTFTTAGVKTRIYANAATRRITVTAEDNLGLLSEPYFLDVPTTAAPPPSSNPPIAFIRNDGAISTRNQTAVAAIEAKLGYPLIQVEQAAATASTIANNSGIVIGPDVTGATVKTNLGATLLTTDKPVVLMSNSATLQGDSGLSILKGTSTLTVTSSSTSAYLTSAGAAKVTGKTAGSYVITTGTTAPSLSRNNADKTAGSDVVHYLSSTNVSGIDYAGFYEAGTRLASTDFEADGVTVKPRLAPGFRGFFWAWGALTGDQTFTQDLADILGNLVKYAMTGAAPPPPPPAPVWRRDAAHHPFSPTSPWNIPVSKDAQYFPIGHEQDVNIKAVPNPTGNYGIYAQISDWSHPVELAEQGDTLRVIIDDDVSSRSWLTPTEIPDDIKIAGEGDVAYRDAHSHVITKDHRYAHDMFRVSKPAGWPAESPKELHCRRHHRVDLYGHGAGPQNGTRAYGGAAFGGLIRHNEMWKTLDYANGLTDDPYQIKHALAWGLREDQLFFDRVVWESIGKPTGTQPSSSTRLTDEIRHPGWTPGQSAAGFHNLPGYRWPASAQDGFSYDTDPTHSQYLGYLPMGAFFVVDKDTNVLAITGLSRVGHVIGTAMQRHGGYATDYSKDTLTLYFENNVGAAGSIKDTLNGGTSYNARDLRYLREHFRVVSNNTQATPGGGAIGSERLAPMIPEIDPTYITPEFVPAP